MVLTLHDVAFAEDASFHGPQTEELLERTRRAAARADVVVTPSRASADAATARLGVPRERLAVVPFGADHVPRRVTGDRPRPEKYVVSVGTIEPRKNHLGLLRAWQTLPSPRPRLVLIGRRGWQCEDAVEAIEAAAAQGDVTWLESLPDHEVFRWVRHASALAYPSLLEGFGFPPLEALALGTPVVAGDDPALHETLADAARFCDPRDPASIADALADVLHDHDLTATLKERGTVRASQLTWDACAAGYAEVYASVLKRPLG